MHSFLQQVILSNTVADWLLSVAIILFALLVNKLVSRYVAQLVCSLFRRNWKAFDQQKFIELVIHPLGTFIVVTISIIVLYRLQFPDAWKVIVYKYPLQKIFLGIGTMFQLAVLTWLLLRLIDFVAVVLQQKATADQSDHQLILFFKDFFKVVLGIIGVLLILRFAFNYNISTLITGLSIVGAAIALALKESLENLIASFVVFFDKPFTTGDLVKVQNITGTVERIGLRSTRIRTEQKTYVTVPNKQMVDSILDNLSLRSLRRNELLLHLSLQTPLEKVNEALERLDVYLAGIAEVDSHTVLLSDINANAIVVHLEFYTLPIDMQIFNNIKQQLNLFALATLEELDIKIAGALAPAPALK